MQNIEEVKNFLARLKDQNGPHEDDYHTLSDTLFNLGKLVLGENSNKVIIDEIRTLIGDPITTTHSLQGFANLKPHGYPGDFEMIDKIYTNYISTDEKYRKWDLFFQNQAAPKAVRNRKHYLKELLRQKGTNLTVLNLASGPCRDIMEFYRDNPRSHVEFDCLEIDLKAIEYAREIFAENLITTAKVTFINKNIFRYIPEKNYELIWSAGLFDYFDDRIFVGLLRRFEKFINPGGELVIGNFSTRNPSRAYMEIFGNWFLHYRSDDILRELALEAGIDDLRIKIKQEPEGVNLFLHISG